MRIAVSSLAAALLVFIGLLLLTYMHARKATTAATQARAAEKRATDERNQAAQQRQIAISQFLASEALRLTDTGRDAQVIENASALAVESWRRRKNVIAFAAARKLLPMLPEREISHDSAVNDIAFSPDGSLLVAGTADGSVYLRNAIDGAEIHRFNYAEPTTGLVFSPDGRFVVSVHEAKSGNETHYLGRLLKVDGFNEVREFLLKTRASENLVFSPDSRFLAVESSATEVLLIEATSGLTQVLRYASRGGSRFLTFSPDGGMLASARNSEEVRFTSVETGEEIANLEFKYRVRDIAFSPNGQFLAFALGGVWENDEWLPGGAVQIVSVESWQEILNIPRKDDYCYKVEFTPNSQFLASYCNAGGAGKGSVSLLVQTGPDSIPLETHHHSYLSRSTFSPDGNVLATASQDGLVLVMTTSDGREIARLGGHGTFPAIIFSPDSRYLAVFGDSAVSLVETSNGQAIARLTHGTTIYSLMFSPDSRYLVTGSENAGLRVFSANTGELLAWLMRRDEAFGALSFALSPRSPTILAWGRHDGSVSYFSGFEGFGSHRIAANSSIKYFDQNSSGSVLAALDNNGTLHVARVANGEKIAELKNIGFWYFSPDGKYLTTGDMRRDGVFSVVDTDSGKTLASTNSGTVFPVIFSPDSRFAVYRTTDSAPFLVDFASDFRMSPLLKGKSSHSLSFSPDGSFVGVENAWSKSGDYFAAIVNAADVEETVRISFEDSLRDWIDFGPNLKFFAEGRRHSGTIRLRVLPSRDLIATVNHSKHAWSIFSPDGSYIGTASDDGSAKLLDTQTGRLIASYLDKGSIKLAKFDSGSRYFATVSDHGYGRLVECSTGRTLAEPLLGSLDAQPPRYAMFDIVFSPHNGFVAFGRWSGEVKVVATRDGRIVAELDGLGSRYPEKPLVFSPDDRYLGIFHENNAVSIVNTKTGQTEGRVRHDRHVTNHFFGPDSRLLLTVSFAGVARLISTKTGREVARYGPEEGIQDAEFTTNGKFVAFATKRGVQLFPSNPELLFKQLCEKAGANLSQGEWNDYIGESDPWHATCPNWRTPSDVGGTDRPP